MNAPTRPPDPGGLARGALLLAFAQARERGYAVLPGPLPESELLQAALSLGEVIGESVVALRETGRSYLCRPGPIPFHTDHARADWILWRCEVQDPEGGATQLVDGRAVLEALAPSSRESLRCLELPSRAGPDAPVVWTPILSGAGEEERLFFAPWLEPRLGERDLVRTLERAVEAQFARAPHQVRLEPGEALLVDNRRILHGRGPLPPQSPRRLQRLWLRGGASVRSP